MAFTLILPQTTVPAAAASNERSLYLYYTHTGETARIVFKRNGKYVKEGLSELNQFLRDWRRNEPAKMAPELFDLIWAVYQEVGATQPINIVSAYRSPATNEMLRATSSGVAENSQHTKGHAMDFFIPGIDLSTLRAVAMKHQVGGVGYYPTSGSPFVHLDVGSVRAWPRMTKAQLKKVFPDGKTMHLPSEGAPLSQEGYQYAQAEWNKCRMVPCAAGPNVLLASNSGDGGSSSGGSSGGKTTLMDIFFGGNDKGQQQEAVQVAAATEPTQRVVQTIEIAPTPATRPSAAVGSAEIITASVETNVATPQAIPFSTVGSAPLSDEEMVAELDNSAPIPAMMSRELVASLQGNSDNQDTAVMAIAALEAPVPAARVLMTNPPAELMTAYAPTFTPDPEAQKALEMLIERANVTEVAAVPAKPAEKLPELVPALRTASLAPDTSLGTLGGLMDLTWTAVTNAGAGQQPMADALKQMAASQPLDSVTQRAVQFTAPDIDHVQEVFVAPVAMESGHFAVMFEAEGYFDKGAEIGPMITKMGFSNAPDAIVSDKFTQVAPQLVAAR